MSGFKALSEGELNALHSQLQDKYDAYKQQKLSLDMSRGKPSPEQLDLSMGMLDVVNSADSVKSEDGTDLRNYGGLDGIPEAKQFFADMLEVSPKEIIVGGNASLSIMYDTIARAMFHGVYGSETPWGKLPKVKFLAPSPGYDRHFAICEHFGIEMITIDMLDDGPDMDAVEQLVAEDESIKGIWCVPKYSNPDGITYSDEVVDRLAKMNTKAKDFRIFWDNAYVVHHLTDKPDELKNIMTACKEAGHPDRVFIFSSTSKVSFAGAGVGVMAASEANLQFIRKSLSVQTIGADKINQLRHVRFFKDMDTLKAHMEKHAAILKPKFDIVLDILEAELGDKQIATWKKPNGGYFISLNTLDGCAKEVVKMAKEAGVTLTGAGATFPYGVDPRDRNIRIAPSYPPIAELKKAIEVLCVCVQLVSVKKLLGEKAASQV
ncbi:aminotransferase class I/II-fold pyridoxal phosphate-dependent enzyme [Brevibacillus migulae]|uniref:aminotransferase class I/II-fold pyridoxal phosphate-dependent enzyme n=1 Tax=Brevibacillus migulae TaxID=1644114 RepID=UPI00106DF732|nr:aminotransferase class I/II-fold pyridoxal phosphate-dependent enzyme [Brevibacillus migulae]